MDLENDLKIVYQQALKTPELYDLLPYTIPEFFMEFQKMYSSREKHILYGCWLDNELVGMIGFLAYRREHRSIEIGPILIFKDYQKRKLGLEAGILLARFALDDLAMLRVEWKCHHLNIASKNCALKIGFVYEGCLRNHLWVKGAHRDTQYFSMIAQEKEIKLKYMESVLNKM